MDITEAEIIQLVGHTSFLKGQTYQRQGRIQALSRDDGVLLAIVRGSGGNIYETTVDVWRDANKRLGADGTCSCPVGMNCKHVAAALIEARRSLLLGCIETTGSRYAGSPSQRFVNSRKPLVSRSMPPGTRSPPDVPRIPAPTSSPAPVLLPPHILDWIDRLGAEEPGDDYPAGMTQRLLYVLTPRPSRDATPALSASAISVRLLKSGAFSETVNIFNPLNVLKTPPAKYLRRSDLSILKAVALLELSYGGHIELNGSEAAAILTDILKTGRARWETIDGVILAPGPAKQGRFVWRAAGNGTMQPHLELEDDGHPPALLLAATPPLYVIASEGLIGPVETGIPAKAARAMLQAPPLAPAQLAAIAGAMRAKGGATAGLAPPAPSDTVIVRKEPVPILDLFRADIMEDPFEASFVGSWHGGVLPAARVGAARLSFSYGAATIGHEMPGASVMWVDGDRLLDIRRDTMAEKAARRVLLELGLKEVEPRHGPATLGHAFRFSAENDWFGFLYGQAPDLAAKGWEIRIASDFPYQLLHGDSDIEASIRESSGLDWFELDLGIMIDGERVDLVPLLIKLITTSEPGELARMMGDPKTVLHLQIGDGRYLSLPGARIGPFVETLSQLFSGAAAKEGRMRYSVFDAAHLARLDDIEGTIWSGAGRIRALGRKLAETGRIPDVALPEGFLATLRPYQARGFAWLDFLRETGFGGILADDMGLGKTIQALALIASEKAAGRLASPALVIAPTSLMTNWRREAEKFAPGLKVLVLQGHDRRERFDEIDAADLVLSTYPLVARDKTILEAREWHILLLDEAQAIKNPVAATTRLICSLKARHRFCLTGTPVENNLAELWSLFHFVAPGFLGDAKSFARDWRTPIEKQGNGARARRLAARVRPFLLRRTKDTVALDLPAKTEMVETIAFEPAQQVIYDMVRLAMHERVREAMAEKGLARSRIVLLDALLKLRQTCCDPRLLKGIKGAEKAGSAKLERLMVMVEELVAEGRKILIFSQFTSMLDLIRLRLEAAGIAYALLTGDTKDRAGAVSAFQEGPAPVFLISLKAGGTGLNLTAADTVILYDPWWNPAVEAQAIDRAHRIGQIKPVFVFKLTAAGTIEEKIEILKERKAAIAASLFDPDGPATLDITEADIEILFGD